MPNIDYNKLIIKPKKNLPKEVMEKVLDYSENGLDTVLARLSNGLVGELLINDDINSPYIKKGDIVVLKESTNLRLKDFVLYVYKEKYYLRRVLKIVDQEIYVAGDNEKEYHITKRSDIVAKGISRIRNNKYKSFNLKRKNQMYMFFKYNLQYFRFKSRIIRPENEEANEALEQALKANLSRNVFVNKTIESKISDELDNELINFIDPDTLVHELEEAMKEKENAENVEEEQTEEVEEVVIEIPEEIEEVVETEDGEVVENLSEANTEEATEETLEEVNRVIYKNKANEEEDDEVTDDVESLISSSDENEEIDEDDE